MRIVYKKLGGRPSDLRFAEPGYVLQADELELEGDVLPSLASLADPKTVEELAAEAARAERLALDEVERLETKTDNAMMQLLNATPAQRLTWVQNNFPTLTAPEQGRFAMILNILAVTARIAARP